MANNSLKVSELPIANSAAPADRLVILRSPNSSPSVRTITVSSLTANLSYANTTTAGVVKVGDNLSINATGHLSVSGINLSYANSTTAGVVKVGDNLTINATGYLSTTTNNDFSATFSDGVNNNRWHIVTVEGTKEFDYQTAGHLKLHIPITSALAGTKSNITINLAGQDLTALRDAYDYGSNIRVYLNDARDNDHYVGSIRGAGFAYPETQAANEYRIAWNSGDITLVEGEELTLQYYTRGTRDTYDGWNEVDTFVPDQTTSNTNQVVLDFNTFDYLSADDITALKTSQTANCSIRFWQSSNNQLDVSRKIISVANTDSLYTITFDGPPINVVTPTLTTLNVTHARNQDNDYYIAFDAKRYPEFKDCLPNQNNKYTDNTNRSGYVIINGDTGNPYDFYFNNYITNEGMYVIELSTSYHINPTDTIEVHYYRAPTQIALYIYRPDDGGIKYTNSYYGKKWFDWLSDLPQRYYNNKGNGVQSGTIKTQVALYDQATREWSNYSFPFTTFDSQQDFGSWFSNYYGDIHPYDSLDQDGIYFYSDWTGWGDSRLVKVRIMYKMELIISEFENNYWY